MKRLLIKFTVCVSAAIAASSLVLGLLSYWVPTGLGWYGWEDHTQRWPIAVVDCWRGGCVIEFGHPAAESWVGKGIGWQTGRARGSRIGIGVGCVSDGFAMFKTPILGESPDTAISMKHRWWVYRLEGPFWLATILFAFWPAVYLWRGPLRRRRRRRLGLCERCGYDLRGQIDARCPECGTAAVGAFGMDSTRG